MNSQFLRFIFVGCIGFFVDASIVFILTEGGLPPILARIPAIMAAIFMTWIMNRTFTFRVKVGRSWEEVVRYVGVALSTATFNFLIYTGLILIGIWPVFSVAISTLILLFYSFFAYRLFVFARRVAKH